MTKREELEEKRQEALAELKDRVRCADYVDEDYVDCVSKEAQKIRDRSGKLSFEKDILV